MMERLTHEEIQELLGAYALDAVDGDEAEQVELHLHDCPRCRAEVAEHREVAALLAYGGAPAPDGVWSRIVDSLEEAPPAMRLDLGPTPTVVPFEARRKRRAVAMAMAAASVAAAIVIAALGLEVVHQRDQIDRIQAALPSRAAMDALADPRSREADLVSPDGTMQIKAVATESGAGYIFAADLPSLPSGRIYQLWGLSGDTPISLGVLGPDPSIVPFAVDRHFDGLAITSETGPVQQPTSTPLVAGAFA